MFDGITSQPAYTRTTPANNPQQAGNQANNNAQNQNTAAAQNTAAQQPQPHQPQFNQPVHAAHAAQQPQFTAMGVQGLTAPSALEAAQMGTSNAVTAMGGTMVQTSAATTVQTSNDAEPGFFADTLQADGTIDASDPANRGSHVDTEI
ncbi:hypothetical protein [Thioalkalivibrio sp. ALJ7]|uniref:hypothetical protein n=1 Tax=Thioalkalivibrio sp. ALJ7 TaxID=1158756 RepID=UPI00036AB343|nr:hypothetical protein [Thioalkalivibrio sp. ALJ7]